MATFAETVAKLRSLFGIESSLTLPGAIARLNEQMGLPPTGDVRWSSAAPRALRCLSSERNGSTRIS